MRGFHNRLFYSKAADLCQFFRPMKFHYGSRKILCYNLPHVMALLDNFQKRVACQLAQFLYLISGEI